MPTTFANTIDGNEILAKRSQCDYAGNDIQTTYATKSEVTTGLSGKQDTISDLSDIRAGAADGATAVQPGDLATVAKTGAYSDLSGTPTIPPALSAGNGIDITNNVVSADLDGTSLTNGANGLYVTNPLPTSSSSDEGKVLTVNSSGSAEWGNASTVTVDQTYDGTSTNAQSGTAVAEAIATKEDAFDVGTGLEMDTSGATPTLQVEAPVDIVAGPGIAIDNPDGNTLRVSTESDAETVLWQGTAPTARGDSITLSESVKNFDRIALYWNNGNSSQCMTVDYLNTASAYDSYYVDLCHAAGYGNSWIQWLVLQINTTARTILFDRARNFNFGSQSSTTWTNPTITTTLGDAFNLYKVVGIHRIANN